MKVVFRVDASLQMGTGHVMRCLTLAQVLKDNGAKVEFICGKHEGSLIDKIHSSGLVVHELEILEAIEVDNQVILPHFLGATQYQDANDCIDILKVEKNDWLIVDHYALDEKWEKRLKPYCEKLMVIDDLADRKHQCDILLDQTFGRKEDDYLALTPKDCEVLLGSQYALLRPEFSKWRTYSLERRSKPKFKKLLINLGGVDIDNVTENVLDELKLCDLPHNITIVVVMGGYAPHLESVKSKARTFPYKTEVKVDVDNMAEIMANSDIAIGAAGSTTWERCCLGLPTIQIVIAENQATIAKNLDSINAIKLIDKIYQLSKGFDDIRHSINKISLVSSSILDGNGSKRVADFITFKKGCLESTSLRPVALDDASFVYSLQTKETRRYFINPEVPDLDEHYIWFKSLINSSTSQLFVLEFERNRAGVLRIDNIDSAVVEISIIVSQSYGGKGVAKTSLKLIESLLPNRTLKAVIHNDNLVSKYLFNKSGFNPAKKIKKFTEYTKIV